MTKPKSKSKGGRPPGSVQQDTFRAGIAAGLDPVVAAQRAGFADAKRAAQRLSRLAPAPELKAAAAEAHAELVTHAEIIGTHVPGALQRLTNIIALGADKDAISAARAVHAIAPDPETQGPGQLIILVTRANERGPMPLAPDLVVRSADDAERLSQMLHAERGSRALYVLVEIEDQDEDDPQPLAASVIEPRPPPMAAEPKPTKTKRSALDLLQELVG